MSPISAPPGNTRSRQRLVTAFRERARARAIRRRLERRTDCRMRLETLHFVEGAEVRVLIVETDDEPDRDLTVLHMIEEGTAVGAASIGQPTVCSTRPGSWPTVRPPTAP